jgi:hypothetical protein
MLKKSVVAMVVTLLAACLVGPAAADVVCQDSSYCEVQFNRTYPGTSQFSGLPYDYLTVAPDGQGETFTEANGVNDGDALLDIEVRVYLRNCQGTPLEGIPAQQIQLFSGALCICPGGADSDAGGTDDQGCATFTGSLSAGGCAGSIDVYADGLFICTLMDSNGRTVKINSTDQAHTLTSPCFTDASDLAGFAAVFTEAAGDPGNVCFDYNERDGFIDASDLAGFASALGAACQ